MKGAPAPHISLEPAGLRVRVAFQGETVADSRDAIALKEGSYPVVYYVPRKDVKMERLARSAHSSHCPYKGDASYYSVSAGGKTAENAVWSYEDPFDEMTAIKELLAFYPDKVELSAG
jgi:uncharacterized protein (DUF427 family)